MIAMCGAFATSLYGILARAYTPKASAPLPFAGLEPIYLGLLTSLAIYAIGVLLPGRTDPRGLAHKEIA